MNPVACVALTDLMTVFPDDEPPFPVLWGSTSHITEAPFGEVVSIAPDDWE